MVHEKNGEYSRLPELKDLVAICRYLNDAGAEYILIGGFAIAFYGFARGTKDIDFLVNDSEENVRKIKQALAHLPDNAIAAIKEDEVKKYSVVRIADEVVVDLLAKACGITFDQAKNEIEYQVVDNVKIPVASRKLLIKTKDTMRPGDKMDVDFLKAILEEEKK